VPTQKLTALGIEALPIPEEDERQADYNDSEVKGLSIRVFSSGRRSWYLRYRSERKRRRFKLGDYPTLTLSAARKKAVSLKVAVRDGEDPVRERQERRDANTLGDLIDWYLSEYASKELAPKTLAERTRILRGKDVAMLVSMAAGAVTPFDVAQALDRIEKRGSRVMLNRTQIALSAVFNWAAIRRRMGVIQNPVKVLPRRFPERSRSRVLDADEIRTVWNDFERREVGATAPLQLVLVTAQRPGEVAAMQWEHIDLEAGLWRMPEGYRKKPRGEPVAPAHEVPLTDLGVETLRAAKTLGGRKYVFPTSSATGHLLYNGMTQAARRLVRRLKMDRWTPHDLRRTASTHMTAIGIDRHVVDRVLGHKDTTVLGIYDRHAYLDERRTALDAWGERLRDIVESER